MEGDPIPEIEWFVDGDKIKKGGRFDFLTDGDLVTLRISETSAMDEGEYQCTATNENGTATCTAELIVNGERFKPLCERQKQSFLINKNVQVGIQWSENEVHSMLNIAL